MFILLMVFVVYFMCLTAMKMDKPSKVTLIIFASYWLLAMYIPTTGFHDLYQPSTYAYLLLFSSLISFTVGFASIKIGKANPQIPIIIKEEIEKLTKNKWIKRIAIITALYLVSKLIIFSRLIGTYASLRILREDYFKGILYGPEYPYLSIMFLKNLTIFFMPLFCYLTFNKRGLLWVLSGIIVVADTILSGGRFGYMYILLCMIMMEVVFRISKIKRKVLIILFSVLAVFFLGILIISTNAQQGEFLVNEKTVSSGRESTTETITTYTAGPIIAFSQAVEHNFEDKIGGFQFGRLTLCSFDMFIDYITSHLLGFSINPALGKITFKQEDVIQVGSDVGWNALYTWCLFFYLDYGPIGCIVIPFFIGLLFRHLIRCLYRYPTYSMLVLVFFFFYVVIQSTIDYRITGAFLPLFLYLMYNDWNERLHGRNGILNSRAQKHKVYSI